MRAVGDFTLINQPEKDTFAFDFTNYLQDGETVASIVGWVIGVETGSDPDAPTRVVGPAQLQGNLIVQAAQGFLPGVVYWMSGQVLTSKGRTPLLWASLPCGVIGC